tara:strand:+ start:1684 stop:1890 length:207 start_codon:yes stop_codon:yes gene_type:complete
MNLNLKHALVDYPEPAWKVAMQIGICDVRLSKIVRGLIEPRPEERIKLAAILGKEESVLFISPADAEK